MAQGKTVINAMIIPLSSASPPPRPTPGPRPPTGGGAPPVVDNTLPGDIPRPENPIYYPLPPGVPVYPDNSLPGSQPGIDNTLPGSQPRPDHTLPGPQPGIDNSLPESPDGGWEPVYIWGGGPHPALPIVLPPEIEMPDGSKVKPIAIWTPANGWETVVIVKPDKPTVTPSKRR